MAVTEKNIPCVFFWRFGSLDRDRKMAPNKNDMYRFFLSDGFPGPGFLKDGWVMRHFGPLVRVGLYEFMNCVSCWWVLSSFLLGGSNKRFCKVWKHPVVFRYWYCVFFFSKILLDPTIEYENGICLEPIGSMYGIFNNIHHKNQPTVGKYTIRGSYGYGYVCYLSTRPKPCFCWGSILDLPDAIEVLPRKCLSLAR